MTINCVVFVLILTSCLRKASCGEHVLSLDAEALADYKEKDKNNSHWLDSLGDSISSVSSERRLSDLQSYPFLYIQEEIKLSSGNDLPTRPNLIKDGSDNIFIIYENTETLVHVYGAVLTPLLSLHITDLQISLNSGFKARSPVACLLSDNKIVIVWEYTPDDFTKTIYGKILNSDYTDFLQEFQISDSSSDDDQKASVDCFPSGGFVATWLKVESDRDVYFKIYDSDGNNLTQEIRANDILTNNQIYPKVRCFSDNSFIIAWMSTEDPDQKDLKAKIFDENGNKIVDEFQVSDKMNADDRNMDLVILSDTKVVVLWCEDDSGSGSFYSMYRRIFDYRGNPLENKFLINNPSPEDERMPIGTKLEDGGFVVAWRKYEDPEYIILAQRFDEDGNEIDGEIALSTYQTDFNYPALGNMKSGGYVAIWINMSSSNRDIYIRLAEPCDSINCLDCSSGKDTCSLCEDGFISNNNTSDNSDPCVSCDLSCETCFGFSDTECSSCEDFLQLANGLCVCQDGRRPTPSLECECPSSSFDSGSDPIECSPCALYCQSCLGQDTCLSCDEGLFLENGECKRCEDNCKRCLGEKECLECEDTFDLESGECECALYHVQEQRDDGENICVYRILSFSFSSSYELLFDKNLSAPLTSDNIEYAFFLPSLQNATLEITMSSLSEYSLQVSSQIPSGSSSILFRLQEVYAEDGSTIKEEEREVTADVFYVDQLEQKLEAEMIPQAIPVTITTAGSLSAGAGAGSSVGISFLSMQPSALWSFLNIASIVYLAPLQNMGAPEALKNFTQAFGGNFWTMIPNLGVISKLRDQNNHSNLLQDYNITSSSILINSGVILLVFCIGISFLPVLIVLYFISIIFRSSLSTFLLRKIKNYRWDYLIRSSIQMYTEIIFFSLVSLKSSYYLSSDYILSGIFVFLGFSILFTSTFFTIIYRKKIKEGEFGNFKSFYEELETKRGLMVSLFYPFFFLRRLLFCFGIHFLSEYSFIQVIINSSVTFVFIGYLIACRPFKDKSILLLNVISETLLGTFLVLSGCFLLDLSEYAVLLICQLCVLSITIIPIISLVILSVSGIRKCCKKKVTPKVHSLRDLENETIVFQRSPRRHLDK